MLRTQNCLSDGKDVPVLPSKSWDLKMINNPIICFSVGLYQTHTTRTESG